ncbi:short-chain dehydrogenase/reductase SDR [Fibrisoma limi BUZ 3]|uniref:Short-chain dehydrogenase/reductase SDR n=2 Tax=Fibrisoma limi TaxID=663275 RepID=I2GJ79_9BACT|nr:short-chain dehydrogenase/reductase SDR [Fibrisoma limi BUZ 3]
MAVQALISQRRKTDFRGQTVVVTGGSRGLGLVLARQFAQEGAKVAICARDEAELGQAEADLRQYGNFIFTFPCDVTDRSQVADFIQAVRRQFGPIDVLVNNAGTIVVTPYENATEADFREVMEANFWSAFNTISEVLPAMRERQSGRIVNIASFGGKVAVPHLLPYVASKFSLVGYSEGLHAEVLKDGVYVTTVCPGLIRTGSPRNAWFKGQNEKEYAWFKIGDSMPFLSVSAERCAHEIIEAARYGKAELIVSLPAKLMTAVQGIAPGLTSELLSVVNNLLPDPGSSGQERVQGKDSESKLSDNFLTATTDKAAEANNQLNT